MRFIFAVPLIAFLSAAWAQPMQPDRWNGVVPEGSAGFSTALYYSSADGVVLNLSCTGPDSGLGVFVQALNHPSGQGAAGWHLFARIEGRDWPVGAGSAPGTVDLSKPWPGQTAMLAAIAAGATITLYAAPDDGSGPAERLGAIPGIAGDPGYAHVAADCGDGPPVKGAVETRDDYLKAPVVGRWQLRERGENYATPVAVAWVLKPDGKASGGALGLFCDGAGQPAAYIFGYAAPHPDETIAVTFTLGTDRFDFTAATYATDHVFRVSRRFVQALQSAPRLDFVASSGGAFYVDLGGAPAAISHAYANCGAAADF